MPKIKGHGGWWVQLTGLFEDHGQSIGLIIHNAEWEILTHVEVREYRSLFCRGWQEGLPRFRRVDHATFKVAEEDKFFPQSLGITEGTEQTFFLKRGELDEVDLLQDTIIESVRVMNDQKKARWVEIVAKLGYYKRDVKMPLAIEPE